jgi:hypothetical protein
MALVAMTVLILCAAVFMIALPSYLDDGSSQLVKNV